MNIAIYTITSELHDAKSIDATTRASLESLDITYDMRGNDFSDYGSHALDLIYIRTGGTEGIFKPRWQPRWKSFPTLTNKAL